jgi:asparagine synthetase B (glutamine-hydrolysing)
MDLNIGAALWLAARAEGQRVLLPVRCSSRDAADSNVTSAPNGTSSSSNSISEWRLVTAEEAVAVAAGSTTAVDSAGSSSSSSAVTRCCYRSAARVVLLGHGADEQCGGYGRHRTRFRLGGWQGLGDELAVDVKRLWIR